MYSKEQITQALKLHFFGTGSYYFKPFFLFGIDSHVLFNSSEHIGTSKHE